MKSLFYLIGFAMAAFFCWNYLQPEPIPEPTGEQQIQAIAESGHADAKQLASLAKTHPTLFTQALRGRRLSVTGVLQKALVRGVAADELSLDLSGTDGKKVSFGSNHSRLSNKGHYAPRYRFEKIGSSIFVKKTLLFREGSQTTLEGTFKYINASSVMLDRHPPQN